MKNSQRFAIPLVIVIVVLLGVSVGVYTYKNKPVKTLDQTADWKTYTDNQSGISFQYPSIISLKQAGENITLGHSIAYTHPNPCDFKGDAPPMDKLFDFSVTITVYNKNLADTEKDNFVWSYEKFDVGSLYGFKGEVGMEGCGSYIYLFPISENKTLVVRRPYVTEFNPIISDYQKYLALPGIINPTQEENYFNQILSTFKFTENN